MRIEWSLRDFDLDETEFERAFTPAPCNGTWNIASFVTETKQWFSTETSGISSTRRGVSRTP
jgi:hypothetical protein